MTVPVVEPITIHAGDTLKFTRSLPDYPASEWTLTYRLIPESGTVFTFAATADDDGHSINVAASETANWVPGDYWLTAVVTRTVDTVVEQYSVYAQRVVVYRNKASETALEFRSWAERALASLEAALEKDAGSGAMIEYSINGRTFRKSYSEALKLKDYLKSEIAQQGGAGSFRKIKTRFGNPSHSGWEKFV